MKKRMMSCFMALALCLTLLPTAALAADDGMTHTPSHSGKELKMDNTLMKDGVVWNPTAVSTYGSDTETSYALDDGVYYLGSNLTIDHVIMINGNVKLCLNGFSITCTNPSADYVIAVYANTNSELTLTDCKPTGKIEGGKSAGVELRRGYTLNMHGGTITGGVDMSGNTQGNPTQFNMYGGTITGGGVGVRLTESCEFTMSGGTISGNKGGVFTGGGEFTMSGGDITGSRATNGGGVNIGNGGKFEMSGTAKITGNTAAYAGGGVYVSGGTFIMNGGEIKSNTAETNGGGVYVTKAASSSISAFTMNGGEISGNSANYGGGGVFVENGTFTVSGKPTVSKNTSGSEGNKVTDNVYLYPNKTITIGNGLTGGTIGVTTGSATPPTGDSTVAITTSTPNANGYLDYFKSDNDSYDIVTNKQHTQLELKAKPKTELTSSNTKITITNDDGFMYSGTEITPKVMVTYNGSTDGNKTLELGKDYTVSGDTGGTNAGKYTLKITGKGNYTGSVEKQWKIMPLTVNVSSVTLNDKGYNGSAEGSSDNVASVIFNGVPTGAAKPDYTIESVTYDNANAGTRTKDAYIVIKLKENGNYAFSSAGEYKWTNMVTQTGCTITQAPAPQAEVSCNLDVANNKENTYMLNLSEQLPTLKAPREYGAVTYGAPTVNLSSGYYTDGAKVEDGKLILPIQAVVTEMTGNIGTIKVAVNSQNYATFDLTINVKAVAANKIVPTGTPTLSKTTLAWGEQLSTIALSGTMTDPTGSTKTVKGKFEWVTPGAAKEKIGEYEAAWKFTPDEDAVYTEATGTVKLTVTKATPKGAPGYTKITTTGKTLADAALTKGNIQPADGEIKWEQGDKAVVTANTAYKWVFTPDDKEHYDELTGFITPYSVSSNTGGSSSGGGSSSDRDSSDSNPVIKTETKNHPDGSTTKTETRRDGSVTQTTTGKDGAVSKTETKKDGSSVTENKAADGSTGTVKTDKNGQTEAKTALSSKAIEDAKRNGDPVTAPVQVEATRNSSTAPTVKIELPRNSGETKVEIPVTNVKPGTVAVLVHPDGTEEIVKNSLPTEDGIQLTVDGSATVKIVDNSKDFIDTRNHWAEDEIDFVSARGLINGMSATIYAPNNSTTRAQLWTILARQNNADLNGGSVWYEKAQNWAKDKGVSDGANPNGTINRAQMVTMLWRAVGQPTAGSAANFIDVSADAYYAQAVAWAIENGITAGVGGGRFDPNSPCTRAQIAAFLTRLYAEK